MSTAWIPASLLLDLRLLYNNSLPLSKPNLLPFPTMHSSLQQVEAREGRMGVLRYTEELQLPVDVESLQLLVIALDP